MLEDGPVKVNSHSIQTLGAVKITGELKVDIEAEEDLELFIVDVLL
jgi:hypothetical protein